jgi:hypothetical protein
VAAVVSGRPTTKYTIDPRMGKSRMMMTHTIFGRARSSPSPAERQLISAMTARRISRPTRR